MPKQDYIIKDGAVTEDAWQWLVDKTLASHAIPDGQVIVSLDTWLQAQKALSLRDGIGVLLNNDCDLDAIASALLSRPLIAIDFPLFTDGRGFSLARLLRDRYGYRGDLRACGHIIRDQLCYLKRCGFNEFSPADKQLDLNAALASLNDFSEAYQTGSDQQQPLFRRRLAF
ncbi:MAG: DUF934 domain-containing protein [Cellvibrionaceae bacterium]|nr:DUF934 domain-containing protein [Cellvibrionaceae bacterium]